MFRGVTSGWFLDTVFKPKSAVEPGVGSYAKQEQPGTVEKTRLSFGVHLSTCFTVREERAYIHWRNR